MIRLDATHASLTERPPVGGVASVGNTVVTILGVDGPHDGSPPVAGSTRWAAQLHRSLGRGAEGTAGAQLDCRLFLQPYPIPVAGGPGPVLPVIWDALGAGAELVWIHYTGPVTSEVRACGGAVVEIPVLLPHGSRPLPVPSLLAHARMSPARTVVVSLDVTVAGPGVLERLAAAAAGHLGPRCSLVAVESSGRRPAFTLEAARLFDDRPELVSEDRLFPTLAAMAGTGGDALVARACDGPATAPDTLPTTVTTTTTARAPRPLAAS